MIRDDYKGAVKGSEGQLVVIAGCFEKMWGLVAKKPLRTAHTFEDEESVDQPAWD